MKTCKHPRSPTDSSRCSFPSAAECTRKSLDINIYVKFKMAHKEVDPLMHFDLGRAKIRRKMRAGRRKVSVFYHSAGRDL